MKRCKWCNLNSQLYVKYHDEEWGRPVFDDNVLFEFFGIGAVSGRIVVADYIKQA